MTSTPPHSTEVDHRSWIAIAVVGLCFAAGIVLVILRHWRKGSVMMGGAVFLAAILRAVLPPRLAGLLVVRSRLFDVAFLAGMGVAIMILGMWVPGTSF